MIGIGVVGLGGMGSFHTSIFSKVRTCRVVAGTDVSKKARRAFSQRFDRIRVHTSFSGLLADPDVAAIMVTTPTLLHKQFVMRACARENTYFAKNRWPVLSQIAEK